MNIGTFFLLTGQGVDITKEIPAGYLVLFVLVMAVVLRIARKVIERLFLPGSMAEDDVPALFVKRKNKKDPGKGPDNE
ncbi:MAG: hypothetical protein IJG64_02620 [Oscillospiraceae bacterium]|nr:hypothetical protein [Oscillospiraceae bacterium]